MFAFSLGAAFFFAPLMITVEYEYILGLIIFVGALYGYFTANFVFDLDHVTKNHHAGVWVTALSGTLLGFFVLQNRFTVGSQGLLPSSSATYHLGLAFAVAYLFAYTGWLLYREERNPL